MTRKKSVGIAMGDAEHALIERIRTALVAQERRATYSRLASTWRTASRSSVIRLALEIAADKLEQEQRQK